jgi:hypothetical protein
VAGLLVIPAGGRDFTKKNQDTRTQFLTEPIFFVLHSSTLSIGFK